MLPNDLVVDAEPHPDRIAGSETSHAKMQSLLGVELVGVLPGQSHDTLGGFEAFLEAGSGRLSAEESCSDQPGQVVGLTFRGRRLRKFRTPTGEAPSA